MVASRRVKSASEVSLRVDLNWEPLPDVIGYRSISGNYPTEPVDVVIEILSFADTFPTVMAKCRHYTEIGQNLVFILDPEARIGYEWRGRSFETIQKLLLPNSQEIDLDEVWAEFDHRLA
jgi:Uma2 family endonuclease